MDPRTRGPKTGSRQTRNNARPWRSMRFCVRGCTFWPRLVAAPARAHPELPQCSCSPIGTFALPAPRQKSRFGDAFSACKEQISVATVTSSRNLSYHYTPRLGFKACTPALKHAGVGACSGCVARARESMRVRLARLTCARNHVKLNSTNHFHIMPITHFLPGSPTCSEWPRRVLEASTNR